MAEAQKLHDPYGILPQSARANPQAIYAKIRAEDPIHRVYDPTWDQHYWFITRYDDCITALKDPRIGKNVRKNFSPEMLEKFGERDISAELMNNNMLFVDPPDHTRLRGLVHKAFTPRIIENLRGSVEQIAADLLDAVEGESEFDLIDRFAFPLPITVIAELLGIPVSDQETFRRWTNALLFGPTHEDTMQAAMEFIQYFNEMFEDRRASPQDDLITNLVQVEEDGEKLEQIELLSMVFLLLVAGHETTVNLIGNGMLALMQNPDQMHLLRQNPDLMKSAVEEILRYNGPIEAATMRWVFEDTQYGEHTLKRGDAVLVSLVSANRDPAHFEDPDAFDISRFTSGRDTQKHIGFGNGIHYCLGAPLARMEGAIALHALLNRFKTIELATNPDDLVWRPSLLIHGVNAMPVKVTRG